MRQVRGGTAVPDEQASQDAVEENAVTTRQIAKELNVSYDQVLKWAKQGMIPSRRIGQKGNFEFDLGDVLRTIYDAYLSLDGRQESS